MKKQLGFYVDMDSCTGCGACVLACRDRHTLHGKVSRRRILEREAGGFERQGFSYLTNVFVYYLPMSCNHCMNPSCAAKCPAGAISKREEDGLVVLDSTICTGCQICLSHCPFSAISYEVSEKKAAKCNGCQDKEGLDEGPACVAACPMRALDFGTLEPLRQKYPGAIQYSTKIEGLEISPSLLVKPHRQYVKKE